MNEEEREEKRTSIDEDNKYRMITIKRSSQLVLEINTWIQIYVYA